MSQTDQDGGAAVRRLSLMQRIYLRCMAWIQTPAGLWVFFFIALAESSFFPIPPDVFLVALCVGAPKKSFKFAAVCTVGSVIGGALGYGLGLAFMDTLGMKIVSIYGLAEKYDMVRDMYQQHDALAVAAAGFTPLPYKLFTITAGVCKVNFFTFILASIVSRAARFFLVAALIYKFGAPVQYFIRKYFNILTIIFLLLLIGGFALMKLAL
ncbi:YqaA family protein [Candidatus Electronema sp. JC]|uniref:YqaA family protein n=1 Tax=Candidatus Electronema sp. JC TaxID=3401570 RepID=UPI003B43C4E0